MRIFLSGLESTYKEIKRETLKREGNEPTLLWTLLSYHYINDISEAEEIRDKSALMLIDSGAFSFQRGAGKDDWEAYAREYAAFIRDFDRPNVLGYFELDIDVLVGYDEVKRLRKIIEEESGIPEKIIPVWHINRGYEDFVETCDEHVGGIVAITGTRNEDVQDDEFELFLKTAHEHGCRIHALGMTKQKIISKVPFDYCDSTSWSQGRFGQIKSRRVNSDFIRRNRDFTTYVNYKNGVKTQMKYYKHWKHLEKESA